jgi:hypothetical protein
MKVVLEVQNFLLQHPTSLEWLCNVQIHSANHTNVTSESEIEKHQ